MFQSIRVLIGSLPERIRAGVGRRSAAFVLALLIEALLVLVVLTLGSSVLQKPKGAERLVSFQSRSYSEEKQAAPESKPQKQQVAKRPLPRPPQPKPAEPTKPKPSPAAIIRISRNQMAALDISALPKTVTKPPAPSPSLMGPADTGTPADTPRVSGSGPNGEPLYAASWYREPYDDELSGYLSTATGPGWGLIACRTVPDFRVDDCVELDEYPKGSHIAHAVLEAAWQFRVRPPRIGGRLMVGEWVRIRIDYGLRR